MKPTLKRILIITLVYALTMGLFIGCNKEDKDPLEVHSKKELIEMVNYKDTEIATLEASKIELETLLKGIQEVDGPTSAISALSDGTGRLTFNSINGKIIFPVPFEYPGATQAPNTASLNIAKLVSIIPTGNWTMKQSGTQLEMEHPSGACGIFKIGSIKQVASRETMQTEVFGAFFNEEFPPDTITYSKIFLETNWLGLQADTMTRVDEKDAKLKCGMVGVGNVALTYMFIYDGESDPTTEEVIMSLVNTIKVGGQQLRVE